MRGYSPPRTICYSSNMTIKRKEFTQTVDWTITYILCNEPKVKQRILQDFYSPKSRSVRQEVG